MHVAWYGNWKASDTATFHYDYDAPDISPQFYLVGPLKLESDRPFNGGIFTGTGVTLP